MRIATTILFTFASIFLYGMAVYFWTDPNTCDDKAIGIAFCGCFFAGFCALGAWESVTKKSQTKRRNRYVR